MAHRQMTMTVQHPLAGAVRLAGSPLKFQAAETPRRPPPQLGQHTREVLQQIAGYDGERIEALFAAGLVG